MTSEQLIELEHVAIRITDEQRDPPRANGMRPFGDADTLLVQPRFEHLQVIHDERRVGHARQFDRRVEQRIVRSALACAIEDQVDAYAIGAEHFIGLELRKAGTFDEPQGLVEGQRPGLVADADADVIVGENASGIHGDDSGGGCRYSFPATALLTYGADLTRAMQITHKSKVTMDRLKAMANFVRIVDSGSLSGAAEVTGQSVASLVRSLAALERYLGVRLLNRSTRSMALTEEGREYLAWSRRTLVDFDDMEQRLDGRDGVARGLLRITAPVEFGQRYVAPLINAFLKDHPQIRMELSLDDQVVALLDERLDLALRIGQLPDSNMLARPLGATRLVTCASPDYLRSAAPIDSPSALQGHACITLAAHGRQWHFRQGDNPLSERVTPRLMCNQIRAARQASVDGVGIVRLMHYQVADELADGRLVRILTDFEPADLPIQLVYPHSLQLSPRVRAFVEWACPLLSARIPAPSAGLKIDAVSR